MSRPPSAETEISPARRRWQSAFQGLQKMGRSLQLPIYYAIFRFAITWFDLKTPGREPEDEVEDVTKV